MKSIAAILVCFATVAGLSNSARADDIRAMNVAFFGFQFVNELHDRASPAELKRLRQISEVLRRELEQSGKYHFVRISPELRRRIAKAPPITECSGCQLEWARHAGADAAGYGVVTKRSDRTLSVTVYMDDAKDGYQYFDHSADIVGNSDQSWNRGIHILIDTYLLKASSKP